ncbi:hypothetical protein BBFGKLBO_00822 [Synechococcus sp. CBW1107]|nr:hypothetical protein BBFGKLBO_00822 [Synechococcus sp. CBW1107]
MRTSLEIAVGSPVKSEYTAEYVEQPLSFTFRSFDGDWVSVGNGRDRVNGELQS